MRTSALFLTLAVAIDAAIASPVLRRAGYALKESTRAPRKWARVGEAPSDAEMVFSIGLQQSRFDELERQLYEVSDPSHPRYGDHLSAEQVNELVKPHASTLEAVHSWLEENGIEKHRCGYSPAKDWINVKLSIGDAEELFDTKYSVFEHEDGTRMMRTLEWSVPVSLHGHITTIQPTNSFLRSRPHAVTLKPYKIESELHHPPHHSPHPPSTNLSAVCNATGITPTCLRTLYRTIDYTPKAAGLNKVGLNDFLGESNNRSDVSIFLKEYRPEAAAAAYQFKLISIAGGTTQQTPDNETQLEDGTDLEANLDAETILGIAWPTPLTAFSTGGQPPFIPDDNTPTDTNEPYLSFLQYALAQPSSALPQVISTSYGDDEQSVPESYAKAGCSGFAQLGARGVSVIFSSGDSGVGPDGACVTNDGKNKTEFIPAFPAGCPYVTATGATKGFDPEVAAFDTFASGDVFTSGAGFSNYFPRPAYQDKIISAYLKSIGNLNKGLFNPNGRAYPDIAAAGQRFITIWNGTVAILDGTSASAPTASSVFALVNDALLSAGRKPLGFLNPWLYAGGYRAFNDILNGSSAGCDTDGFPAQKGWDAVTGFGTPDFPKILEAVGLKGHW